MLSQTLIQIGSTLFYHLRRKDTSMTYSRCGMLTKRWLKSYCPSKQSPPDPIKFTAEILDKEINFLDTTLFKAERFHKQAILDIRTHFKPTETFQYTHFPSCHPPGARKGFIKSNALRLLRTNLQRNLSLRISPNSKHASVRETNPTV